VLYCWGRNSDGEIGDGTTVNAKIRRPVTGISDLVAVGLGQLTTCVCDRSGKAWCWGRNVEGQLGIGSASATSPTPVQVPGIDDCAQIAGGGIHTCVVHQGGTVSCWGGNGDGQVGQPSSSSASCAESKGSPIPCVLSPVVVPGLTNVAEVRAGEHYVCARKNDLTVWCGGDNSNGTLGDGSNTSRNTPAQVADLDKDVIEIAAGRWFACARHRTGAVSCWGANGSGQLGNRSTTNTNRPVAAMGITDAVQLGAGLSHTCVLHVSGAVSCWGDNSYGQLGNGTTTSSLAPVDVIGLMPVKSIAVGSIHTCARSAAGAAFCWGENVVNEIGDSTTTNRPQPVSVAGFM
jgi:alpha-tubulin suppressor-like RCC1 family protein